MVQLSRFFKRNFIAIIVYCIAILTVAIGGYACILFSWKTAVGEVDQALFHAIRTLKYRVPDSYHDRTLTSDVLSRGDLFKDEYEYYGKLIRDIQNRFDVSGLYILVEIDGRFYLTATDLTEEYFTEHVDGRPELRLTSEDGMTRYSNGVGYRGASRSCVCRFTTVQGNHYLIVADVPMEQVAVLRRELFKMFLPHNKQLLAVNIFTLAALIVLSVWLHRQNQWYITLPSWIVFLFLLVMGNVYIAREERNQQEYWKGTLMDWCSMLAESTQRAEHYKIQPTAEGQKHPTEPLEAEKNLSVEDRWQVWDCYVEPSGREAYLKILDMHRRWMTNIDLLVYVYTVRKIAPKRMEFICSAPADADRNAIVSEKKNEAGDPPFTLYDDGTDVAGNIIYAWSEVYDKAFEGFTTIETPTRTAVYGLTVTIATPLFDPTGEIEAVFAIDIDIDEWTKLADSVRSQSKTFVFFSSFLLLFLTGLVSVLVSFLRKSQQANRLLQEQVRQTENAVSATNAKSAFLANMSHEIRTPMNAILGYSTFLQRSQLQPQDREYVLGIKTASQTLLSLINDVLDFSKIEAGKIEIIPTRYELSSLINDSVNIVVTRAVQKSLDFHVVVSPDLPSNLIGDEFRIRQVITNLLTNAIKFTRQGFVRLTIGGEHMDDDQFNLKVIVRDTGIGINKENLDDLFGAFQQIDTHKNRAIEGTGLGLAISKRFIELMGGSIHVESEHGKGSTFILNIPQTIPENALSIIAPIPPGIRVMVLESKPSDLHNWERIFGVLKIQGRIVSDLDEVLRAFKTDEYTHYFIDETTYAEHSSELVSCPSRIFAVLNLGEVNIHSGRIETIRKPVYSLTVANKLSNVSKEDDAQDIRLYKFTAPTARILVVDDHETNLKIASGLLAPYEVEVCCVVNGLEAVRRICSEHFDLVLMDHMMPEMDGVEATRNIRDMEGEYFRKIPIIAATANAVAGVRESYMKEGFDDYIAKPIETYDLENILIRWIPKQKLIPAAGSQRIKKETSSQNVPNSETSVSGDLLDLRSGLLYAGGNEESYGEVLRSFFQGSEKSLRNIKQAFEDKNWKLFATETHAVKGLAKGIGAVKLSEVSVKMESAGKRGDENYIAKNFDRYVRHYTATLENIEHLLAADLRFVPTEKTGSTGKILELEAMLQEIIESLEDYDTMQAGRLLSQLIAQPLDEQVLAALKEISSKVDRFDYEDSINLLRKLLSKKKT